MDHDLQWEQEALEDIFSDPSAEPIKLSYGLLKFITDNFSNEIGRGGFGVVYKGDLRNGVVAVKRSNGLNVTDKQFMDEIKCLKSTNHKNIVRFLGYCADTQEEVKPFDGTFVMAGERNRLFCFEYAPNGNIRQYLEREKTHVDDWPTRYQMIRGICEGLQYLHDKQINHLDLKPENVMLDAHMEAKITDFGLSRFLDQGQSRIITTHICGTLRYIAPEVIDKRELSFKSDIYALGIMIIELLTATSIISLTKWDESLDLLDSPRAGMCAEIARNCTHAERDNRPTIGEVIHRMDELESMIPKSSTTRQLVAATAFPGTELLDVSPLELRFLFEPDDDYMYSSLTITNKTDRLVYCMITMKDHSDSGGNYSHFLTPIGCGFPFSKKYILTPTSSTVATVRLGAKEEIPSYMVEWEMVMLTTRYDKKDLFKYMSTVSLEEDATFENVIKALQELLGGELHRTALTASVIVESEYPLEVHTLGKEQETLIINSMDVHSYEPWVLLIAGIRVYIWNWQTNEKVGEYNSPAELGQSNKEMRAARYSVAKFIAREQWVVTGDTDGAVTVLTCPTLVRVKRFETHSDSVSLLAVHPTRPFLLSFSLPLSLKLWDWSRDWSCTGIFDVKSRLWQVMFNPMDATTFATCGEDGLLQMWSISRVNPITTVHCRNGRRGICVFTYTGYRDFAAAIDDDETISIWDLRKEKHVHTLPARESRNVGLVCHPTCPILVTFSRYGRIQVWDSTTYRLKMTYDKFREVIIHAGFTGSGRLVLGYNEGIAIMDIALE